MDIYVSQVSLRRTAGARGWRIEDLPAAAVDLGFRGIEISDRTLTGAAFDALSARARSVGCGVIVDVSADLTLADDDALAREVDHVGTMLGYSARAGATTMRLAVGGQSFSIGRLLGRQRRVGAGAAPGRPALVKRLLTTGAVVRLAHAVRSRLPAPTIGIERKLDRCARAMEPVARDAVRLGVAVAIENHWGITSDPRQVARLVTRIDSARVGTCPDFENFPGNVDRYEGLETLASRAMLVHARSTAFRADGEERSIDYGRCIRILRDAGYDGTLTVEYFGGGDDVAGACRTRDLIIRHWATAEVSTLDGPA